MSYKHLITDIFPSVQCNLGFEHGEAAFINDLKSIFPTPEGDREGRSVHIFCMIYGLNGYKRHTRKATGVQHGMTAWKCGEIAVEYCEKLRSPHFNHYFKKGLEMHKNVTNISTKLVEKQNKKAAKSILKTHVKYPISIEIVSLFMPTKWDVLFKQSMDKQL